jgi:hypothetical protein
MKYLLRVVLLALVVSPSYTQAAPCPVASCAKFDIPGAFPGDFYIDFITTQFSWGLDMNGDNNPDLGDQGSLSTASTISFTVAGQQLDNPNRYDLSVGANDFQFIGLNGGSGDISIWGVGSGEGWIDTNTGDWELNMPILVAPTGVSLYFVGNLTFSTLNPGGVAMVIDPNDSDWGKLTITSDEMMAAENVDAALLNQIVSDNNLTSALHDPFTAASDLTMNFVIEGIDPISAVPVPAAAWLFSSALIGLAGIKRKK